MSTEDIEPQADVSNMPSMRDKTTRVANSFIFHKASLKRNGHSKKGRDDRDISGRLDNTTIRAEDEENDVILEAIRDNVAAQKEQGNLEAPEKSDLTLKETVRADAGEKVVIHKSSNEKIPAIGSQDILPELVPKVESNTKMLATEDLHELIPTRSTGGSIGKHYKEKKAFFEALPKLLNRQCELGNLSSFSSQTSRGSATVDDNVTGAWTMTDQGTKAVLNVYADVRAALEYFKVPEETKSILGLSVKVMVQPTLIATDPSVLTRVGGRWLPHIRNEILTPRDVFLLWSGANISRLQKAMWAMGLVRKAQRSDGFADLLLPRLLGLAQLCGIERLSFSDLMELAAFTPYLEKFARAYIAKVIGSIDKSQITNLAYGNYFNGQMLGSTPYIKHSFVDTAPSLNDRMVVIGVIHKQKLKLTNPDPCKQVEFKIKLISLTEGEPVYMLSGWATAIAHRPPQFESTTSLRCLYQDIHGSPHYAEWRPDKVVIKIKRTSDGRLAAKPAMFGQIPAPEIPGQRVFGVPCNCTTRDPSKYLKLAGDTTMNGVQLRSVWTGSTDISYHDLRFIWTAGDLVMQRFRADAFTQSTYIQIPEECLYCAINRALGAGCGILVLGGFPKSKPSTQQRGTYA
ncbi:predicted protein [Uncinocarpus reesii 1704]|uniref:Uncharacterized protein n=1 Tax=Uncinocarpus reesii (strain UAMH 1704) TaxID=336963 RepID=C4JXJ7_UNCRE|nr:uncharacterized protein UREG_06370 [Uncinocarpus reesii 1704]EEP81505.1 predicted protein [Uncinocarpus reesii 1704]